MALTRLIPLRLIRPIPRLGGLRARHLRDRSRGRLRGMLNRLPKWVCPVHRRKLLKAKCPRGKPPRQLRLKAQRSMERPRPRLGGFPKARCSRGKPPRQQRLKARRPTERPRLRLGGFPKAK